MKILKKKHNHKKKPFRKERFRIAIKTTVILLLAITIFSCSKDDDEPTPTLSSINPTSGTKNTVVTINGNHFGTNINNVQVFFNDNEAVVQSVNENEIKAEVPVKAYTGIVKVLIDGTQLIGQEFTYILTTEISTLAGSISGYEEGTGANAQFNLPDGLITDADGNVYVADRGNHVIRKITPNGVVSTFAVTSQGFADGIRLNSKFNVPNGLAIDTEGNIYVADKINYKIRKIAGSGAVTTFAGSSSGFADGTGTAAQFNRPSELATDAQGNVYVADTHNHKIRKITPTGEVSTLAGSTAGFADGAGASAQFSYPNGVTVDSQGNVYVADTENYKIRKITPNGEVSTFAGSTLGFADGAGADARFKSPIGLSIDAQDNVYVADSGNDRIRKITPDGTVSTFAGSTNGFADGLVENALFSNPDRVTVDAEGIIYVSDRGNHKVRKITQD